MDGMQILQDAGTRAAAHAKEGARKDGIPFYYKDSADRQVKESLFLPTSEAPHKEEP
jgi:hypothetical protein